MRSSEHTISPLPIFLLQGQQSSQPADHANPLQEIPDSDDEDDTAQAIQKSSTHRVPHHQGSAVAWSHAGRTATDVSMAQEPKPSSQRQLSSTPSWEPRHQQTLQACTTSHPRSSSTEEIPLPPVQLIQRSAWRRANSPPVIDLTGDDDQDRGDEYSGTLGNSPARKRRQSTVSTKLDAHEHQEYPPSKHARLGSSQSQYPRNPTPDQHQLTSCPAQSTRRSDHQPNSASPHVASAIPSESGRRSTVSGSARRPQPHRTQQRLGTAAQAPAGWSQDHNRADSHITSIRRVFSHLRTIPDSTTITTTTVKGGVRALFPATGTGL